MNEFEKAASVLNVLKGLMQSEHSQPFMASLYAPLVGADLSEAYHKYREGHGLKGAILPGLAGGALAVMMAQHLADPVSRYLEQRGLTTGKDIGRHLISGAQRFLAPRE